MRVLKIDMQHDAYEPEKFSFKRHNLGNFYEANTKASWSLFNGGSRSFHRVRGGGCKFEITGEGVGALTNLVQEGVGGGGARQVRF